MENCRTFVGIPLKVDLAFMESRDRLMEALGGERISWVEPVNYHLTLRFLGDTPFSQMELIREALISGFDPPLRHAQCLAGPGVFGPRKKPRVIWAGFSDPGFFLPLKRQVDQILESCGLPKAKPDFNPHLTLGRIRSLKESGSFYGIMESYNNEFRTRVSINRLIFYRSELTPSGARYTPLAELPFPGSDQD